MPLAPFAETRPSPGWLASVRLAAADIKIAHSVFALPFAILGALLATPSLRGQSLHWPTLAGQLTLVVLCMIFARTWAMLVNRLADRAFDKDNERTARRLIASGALPVARARAITLACALAFMATTSGFFVLYHNPWPLILSVPVLAWIALYSYTKRFTAWCHVFLGGALAVSPLAAALALDPTSLENTPALWFMSAFVLLWVAGFDVLYAIQDIEFDRARGLSSIPAKLGLRGALWTSRGLHMLAYAALVLAVRGEPRFQLPMDIAVVAVAALLVAEHAVVGKRGLAGIPMAFFTLNGVVSCLLGLVGSVELCRAVTP